MEQKKETNTGSTFSRNKNAWISGIIIIIVLALLIVVPRFQKTKGDEMSDNETTELTEETVDTADDTSRALSRAEAIAKYDGKKIEINENCAINPAIQTQPSGTTIMIDNNTSVPHKVTVGGKPYTISGHHYTLSWLNSAPAELPITCDDKVVGKVIVQ